MKCSMSLVLMAALIAVSHAEDSLREKRDLGLDVAGLRSKAMGHLNGISMSRSKRAAEPIIPGLDLSRSKRDADLMTEDDLMMMDSAARSKRAAGNGRAPALVIERRAKREAAVGRKAVMLMNRLKREAAVERKAVMLMNRLKREAAVERKAVMLMSRLKREAAVGRKAAMFMSRLKREAAVGRKAAMFMSRLKRDAAAVPIKEGLTFERYRRSAEEEDEGDDEGDDEE